MPQIFRPGANTLARLALVAIVAVPLAMIAYGLVLARSSYVTGEDRTVEQPIPFSHAHHTAEVGIDCRYCHTSVETAAEAGIPPTATCMTCHSALWTNAEMLAPVRKSLVEQQRLQWRPVNDLPDYVYFSHQVHVTNGVACAACHGAVGEMKLTRQEAPLSMGWCLECHRNPGPNLSPPGAVFSPFDAQAAGNDTVLAHARLEEYGIDTSGLTDCSTCHR